MKGVRTMVEIHIARHNGAHEWFVLTREDYERWRRENTDRLVTGRDGTPYPANKDGEAWYPVFLV